MSKDEAWMTHVTKVLKQGTLVGDDLVELQLDSILASDDSVKPIADIGVYPLFRTKAASASSMKHAMELTMQATGLF